LPTPLNNPLVAGIRISHPSRLIYPDFAFSKLDLVHYYEAIAEWIVPHVRGRPLTLVHCPAGIAGRCLYLKHAKAWGPSALRRVRIQEKTKVGEYLVADSLSAVVALAQMGVVEIHTWNSDIAEIERPNRIVWDLDPGPQVPWKTVAAAAQVLRELLETLGARAWLKTTGGRGLHVVVPIKPSLDWSVCLSDYLRNNRTNTSICAYSPRARAGAPVSTPIEWRELHREPDQWTVTTVVRRLRRRRRDPWADYWTAPQKISPAALRAVSALR
jgi:bifunctional non-homologous end joining protein LigD